MSRLRGSSQTSTLKPDVGNATVGSKEYLLFNGKCLIGMGRFLFFPKRKKDAYE